MPTAQNVDVIRRFNESWGTGNLDTVYECAHPDMEFDWSESIGPFRGTYRGHSGLRRLYEDLHETFEEFRPEIGDPIHCGDEQIITPTRVSGHGRASGIELDARGAMLWEVRGGRIVRAKMFQGMDDALAASGCAG